MGHLLKALLIANGEFDDASQRYCEQLYEQLQPDMLVAIDGGLKHCYTLGQFPDVLIGDLDSATDEDIKRLDTATTTVLRHKPEKDQTDLELALELVNEKGVSHTWIAGLSGGRTDQMLCNWLLLGRSRWRFTVDIVDAAGVGYLVTADKSRRIKVRTGATISLLSLTSFVNGLTTDGLRYALTDAGLPLGSSLGISNVADSDECSIQLTEGKVLAYVNRD